MNSECVRVSPRRSQPALCVQTPHSTWEKLCQAEWLIIQFDSRMDVDWASIVPWTTGSDHSLLLTHWMRFVFLTDQNFGHLNFSPILLIKDDHLFNCKTRWSKSTRPYLWNEPGIKGRSRGATATAIYCLPIIGWIRFNVIKELRYKGEAPISKFFVVSLSQSHHVSTYTQIHTAHYLW